MRCPVSYNQDAQDGRITAASTPPQPRATGRRSPAQTSARLQREAARMAGGQPGEVSCRRENRPCREAVGIAARLVQLKKSRGWVIKKSKHIQAETSKKPTAVGTPPAFKVRESRSRAWFSWCLTKPQSDRDQKKKTPPS